MITIDLNAQVRAQITSGDLNWPPAGTFSWPRTDHVVDPAIPVSLDQLVVALESWLGRH
jgi:hypothetical protein